MDTYGIVVDEDMLRNTFQTNIAEAGDLINMRLIIHITLFGLLPSYFVYKIKIKTETFNKAIISKATTVSLSIMMIVIIVFSFSKNYASFFREHKYLRFYTNPIFYIYSTGKYISSTFAIKTQATIPIGDDAVLHSGKANPRLTIMVVGETARADRFSLNGYQRKTNPLLEKENVTSFKDMSSCGTATAVSVPCMFSKFSRDEYDDEKGAIYENVLDILAKTGVNVLWRDNNSDSKGIALRVTFENYKSKKNNTICDSECRDVGMLVGLQDYINRHKGDILIVLHQMGNHGPAYYKRYPKAFEVFTPTCLSKNIETCTAEQINNSYDNAIVYTDYFLKQTIELLKSNSKKYSTALLYVSDHGESLGENNIYLHGLPYFIAPKEQTHTAAIFWSGGKIDINKEKLDANKPVSHDNIFHSLLGLFDVRTKLYNKQLNIFEYTDRK